MYKSAVHITGSAAVGPHLGLIVSDRQMDRRMDTQRREKASETGTKG